LHYRTCGLETTGCNLDGAFPPKKPSSYWEDSEMSGEWVFL
jgi:hypothetical protein